MKPLGLHEIRKEFLDFFKSKEHLIVPSYSLVPKNDKSLLLIGAGMAPMKKYFTGEEIPPKNRMATCQKCIRTGDIDNVGKTDRHATFFEMLGNFSFGDYFKREAIAWAWEFLTKHCEIEEKDLWATVYQDDEEAAEIWNTMIGLPMDRIVFLGKEDNFWELEVGPSGPCSEIYVDRGEEYGCGHKDCKPGCECDRFIEVWNLVFTQFDKDEQGNYNPLSHPNIDTGMGLERIATVLQQTNNIFEIDAMEEIIKTVETSTGYSYGEDPKKDESVRVITDHIRAITFMISDSIVPSNEGRGYVLRRLIRRAARHGRLLGVKTEFLTKVSDKIIESWGIEYKSLIDHKEMIQNVIYREEQKFLETLDQGMEILNDYLRKVKEKDQSILSGEMAFKLYDTYGFPIDLTTEITEEEGIKTDILGFEKEMEKQKERARAAREEDNIGWTHTQSMDVLDTFSTIFTGYEKTRDQSTLLAILTDGEVVDELAEGQNGLFVVDCTPFYPEGGGQVGDIGYISGDNFTIEVTDTKKTKKGTIYHIGTVIEGIAKPSDIGLMIDEKRRDAIRRNHSVTHLLHKALKEVIGNHVNQAGSLVMDTSLRFDFNHYEGVTEEQLEKVEALVNEMIYASLPVKVEVCTVDEAKRKGAIGLFEDKYGDEVRVVSMGDFSSELCGGTHVDNTAQIGMFKIRSEGGIASGVRRIEGITGLGVYQYLNSLEEKEDSLAKILKTKDNLLEDRASSLMLEIRELEKELDSFKKSQAKEGIGEIEDSLTLAGEYRCITGELENVGGEHLRTLAEELRDKNDPVVVVLGSVGENGKVLFASAVSKEYTKAGVSAGNLLREVAKITGGGGGGRPDFATAGGKNPEKLKDALREVYKILENLS
ncbi:MAG: alanine--tRNA ligase [Tissierellia bacterium]|nr:alanine--tRNA ligase [Tissierellia bacterium]